MHSQSKLDNFAPRSSFCRRDHFSRLTDGIGYNIRGIVAILGSLHPIASAGDILESSPYCSVFIKLPRAT